MNIELVQLILTATISTLTLAIVEREYGVIRKLKTARRYKNMAKLQKVLWGSEIHKQTFRDMLCSTGKRMHEEGNERSAESLYWGADGVNKENDDIVNAFFIVSFYIAVRAIRRNEIEVSNG